MRFRWLFIFGSLLLSSAAGAADHVAFFGTVLKQRELSIEPPCPESRICMDAYIRWQIRVDLMVSGTPLKGVVNALIVEHTRRIDADRKRILFVVRRIEDESLRTRTGADYFIETRAFPSTLYCLGQPLEDFGITESQLKNAVLVDNTGCYSVYEEKD